VKHVVDREIFIRLLVMVLGFGLITGFVYGVGKWLVPVVDSADKAMVAACNPDAYVPVLDEFMRALSDYTNFLIAAPLVSWMIAFGLLRLFPKSKPAIVRVLVFETIVMAALAAVGEIWPNKTYVGANVFLVITVSVAFGAAAFLFHRMEMNSMIRFSRVLWLVLISVCLTDFIALNWLKVAVARPRPLNAANKPWNEQLRVVPDEVLRGSDSFPSGHTSGTFSLLTPLFWYMSDRRVRVGMMGWAGLLGFSRVYTAAHFPFCCIMAGFLGFSVGTLVFFALGNLFVSKSADQDAAVIGSGC